MMSHRTLRFVALLLLAALCPSSSRADDDVMLQAFYWDVPRGAETGTYWYSTIYSQRNLINKYFHGGVWLPVPCPLVTREAVSVPLDPLDRRA